MTLIKNVQVIDGTGKPPFTADVLIKGDRILAVGLFPKQNADTIIDGEGGYVMPGFIDVDADSDHYLTLFTNPGHKNFLLQGVTTIIGGHCGSSLAPLLYGSLESIRKWTDTNQINVDWRTMDEFLNVLERRKLGVNFGTLIGHSTVRRAIIGEVKRDLTINELKVFSKIIDDALREGAFGLSSGLGYAHSHQTAYNELKELAAVVAQNKGVYATHLRDEKEKILTAVKETLKLASETGVSTLITHFRPLRGFEKNFHEALDLLEHSAVPVNFDSYPSDASFVPIYTILPAWAKNSDLEDMLKYISEPEHQKKIIAELPSLKPTDIIVAYAPASKYLVGKTLGRFSKDHGLDLKRGLIKMLQITKLRASIFWKNVNVDAAIQSLTSPKSLLASNAPGLDFAAHDSTINHERIYNIFPKFIKLVSQLNLMPIEQAVAKITSEPARKFGIADRGEIKHQKIADLTIVKNSQIKHVIVNGQLAVKNGQAQNILAGKILRHQPA